MQIEILELQMNVNPDEHIEKELRDKHIQLEELRDVKIKGQMIRARVNLIDNGEKPTKFFLNLEKKNYVNKTMKFLTLENGIETNNQVKIMEETRKYYENLYRNKDEKLDLHSFNDLIDNKMVNSLDDTLALKLEGLLQYQEVLQTLKSMKNGKTPGSDGFTVEFYKFFWTDLSYFIIRSLNFAYISEKLSVSQKLGIITLIPKGNKPRNFLSNWRPISLLNVTYKLASATIAHRIQKVLPYIISKDQKGFMSDRFIGENIRTIYDILHISECEKIPGLILLLDFEKAFDSVSHSFLFKVLDIFNFGTSIKQWIKTFYSDCVSSIMLNGHLSSQFPIKRGCRQGDALSSNIFLLCAEILSIMIRKNKNIKGIKIAGMETVISQYADDTTLFLDGTEESLTNSLNILDQYYLLSGLKINELKTKIFWIGSKKYSPYRIKTRKKLIWIDDGRFSCLGIDFSLHLGEMESLNYNRVFESVMRQIKHWSKRNISLLGRLTVVKSLLLPQFNHLVLSLPDPSDHLLKKIEQELYKFIWQSSHDRIKRNQMINTYENGGVKMIDIKHFFTSLKITWIRRLCNNTLDDLCVNLFQVCTGIVNISRLFWGSNFIQSKACNIENPFWRHVLLAWASFLQTAHFQNRTDFLSQIIWKNDNIQIGGNGIYYKAWDDKGIRYVNDFVNTNGSLCNREEFVAKFSIPINFLLYEGIIKSIKYILEQLPTDIITSCMQSPFLPFPLNILLHDRKGCQNLYRIIINQKSIDNISKKQKWEQTLNTEIIIKRWHAINNLPFYAVSETKLKWFQFRITNRVIATNSFLFLINVRKDNLCTFCKSSEENLEHLFVNCIKVKTIWKLFKEFLFQKCHYIVTLNTENILFGLLPFHDNKAINILIIWIKWSIYKQRLRGKIPNYNSVFKELKSRFETEKLMYYQNMKKDIFNTIWTKFIYFFNL